MIQPIETKPPPMQQEARQGTSRGSDQVKPVEVPGGNPAGSRTADRQAETLRQRISRMLKRLWPTPIDVD